VAYASVDVEACNRPPKTIIPLKDCKDWCSSLAVCASGPGKKPSEGHCWFNKTSSDPARHLQNAIAENNEHTNIETTLELDLVGRPIMQQLNGRAADGIYESVGDVDSCSYTYLRGKDYWGVNLGGRYKIAKVEFSTRFHASPFTLGISGRYQVIVSDVELGANIANAFPNPNLKDCGSNTGNTKGALSMDCDSHEGSFVYIYVPRDYLEVCNVRVFVTGSCCEHQVPENTDCPTSFKYC